MTGSEKRGHFAQIIDFMLQVKVQLITSSMSSVIASPVPDIHLLERCSYAKRGSEKTMGKD